VAEEATPHRLIRNFNSNTNHVHCCTSNLSLATLPETGTIVLPCGQTRRLQGHIDVNAVFVHEQIASIAWSCTANHRCLVVDQLKDTASPLREKRRSRHDLSLNSIIGRKGD
jgi:hypothetical protein